MTNVWSIYIFQMDDCKTVQWIQSQVSHNWRQWLSVSVSCGLVLEVVWFEPSPSCSSKLF